KGVTLATFRAHYGKSKTVDDLKKITGTQLQKIYKSGYWDKVRGDELPSGVDYAVFDYAVNSGPGQAIKHLQEVVGVKVDGIIGPATLAAVNAANVTQQLYEPCDRRPQVPWGLPACTACRHVLR